MDCDFWKSIGIAKHFRWNFSGTMGPSQWRQVIIITRGHLFLLHPFERDIQIGFSVGWYTQENNLERNPKFACGRMYDDHGESAKEQIKPDICQTPFHQKYFRENNSVPFLETKHVPQKKQAITWATKCGTVSHHSLSIPESAFLWGRRFSHFTLTWVDWVSHSQNDGQFFLNDAMVMFFGREPF